MQENYGHGIHNFGKSHTLDLNSKLYRILLWEWHLINWADMWLSHGACSFLILGLCHIHNKNNKCFSQDFGCNFCENKMYIYDFLFVNKCTPTYKWSVPIEMIKCQ